MNSDPFRAAWALPLASVNDARAHMEAAFKTIVGQMLDAHAESVAIAERANKRIADIESAAQAAAQRARLESDIELGHSNELVEALQTELERLRERLHVDAEAGGELSQREAAHRAEMIALREELQAARTLCNDLVHQIDVEKAKHARLIAGVRSMQQTKPAASLIGFVVSGDAATPERVAAAEVPREPAPAVAIDAARPSPDTIDAGAHTVAAPQLVAAPHLVATPQVVATPPVVTTPQLAAAQTDAPDSAADLEATEYARRLLDEIEAVYEADTNSGLSADELVGRLSGNLKYGAAVFARRLEATGNGGTVFDQQLTARHDEKGDTRFGRHLRVATYEYRKQHGNGQPPAQ